MPNNRPRFPVRCFWGGSHRVAYSAADTPNGCGARSRLSKLSTKPLSICMGVWTGV
ncbi:Uncharacterised protein [Mycobacteroides abscessus subsp. abscessus]|nr:Uncharacterised protein [Mycobacteroides abscessus subsp. abscessus]